MEVMRFEAGRAENISKVENDLTIMLPPDYKNFLLVNNGANVHNAFFYVEDIGQTIPMGYFFGICTGEGTDITEINKEYKDDIPDSSLLIGNDAGSGFLLLVFDGENDGVWYYDHTYFFPESTDELNTYFLCESFEGFLQILKETPPPVDY